MADENFTQNPFYIALTKQYNDLYRKACERKCVICVPRVSSLPLHKKSNSLLIKRAELGLHILMPSPLQSIKPGLHDCVQEGYSVIIDGENSCITGYSGFGRNFSAKILSEVFKWTKCQKPHSAVVKYTAKYDSYMGEIWVWLREGSRFFIYK